MAASPPRRAKQLPRLARRFRTCRKHARRLRLNAKPRVQTKPVDLSYSEDPQQSPLRVLLCSGQLREQRREALSSFRPKGPRGTVWPTPWLGGSSELPPRLVSRWDDGRRGVVGGTLVKTEPKPRLDHPQTLRSESRDGARALVHWLRLAEQGTPLHGPTRNFA